MDDRNRTDGKRTCKKPQICRKKWCERRNNTERYSEENVKQIVHEVLEELKQKNFGKIK